MDLLSSDPCAAKYIRGLCILSGVLQDGLQPSYWGRPCDRCRPGAPLPALSPRGRSTAADKDEGTPRRALSGVSQRSTERRGEIYFIIGDRRSTDARPAHLTMQELTSAFSDRPEIQ